MYKGQRILTNELARPRLLVAGQAGAEVDVGADAREQEQPKQPEGYHDGAAKSILPAHEQESVLSRRTTEAVRLKAGPKAMQATACAKGALCAFAAQTRGR